MKCPCALYGPVPLMQRILSLSLGNVLMFDVSEIVSDSRVCHVVVIPIKLTEYKIASIFVGYVTGRSAASPASLGWPPAPTADGPSAPPIPPHSADTPPHTHRAVVRGAGRLPPPGRVVGVSLGEAVSAATPPATPRPPHLPATPVPAAPPPEWPAGGAPAVLSPASPTWLPLAAAPPIPPPVLLPTPLLTPRRTVPRGRARGRQRRRRGAVPPPPPLAHPCRVWRRPSSLVLPRPSPVAASPLPFFGSVARSTRWL